MRGFQCLVLCALLYSASVDAFGECDGADNSKSCPDNAECLDEDADNKFECECEDGFDEIDLFDITIDGEPATVCVDLGYCSPFDNKVDDCVNGRCIVYKDQYESYQAVCKCDDGFYGEKCDSTTQQSGSANIRGEVVLLTILAWGAAVLSSSM